MPIKLLALDIDGTLLTTRGEITPRTAAALAEAKRRGVQVVLVTGRRFSSAHALIQQLKLDVLLISHNGALTKDLATLGIVAYHPLAAETAHAVIGAGRAFGADVIVCDDPEGRGVMVLENVSAANRALQRYLDKYRSDVVEVPDLLEYIDHAPIQIMFSGRCTPMDEFAEQLLVALDGQIQLFKTRYRSYDLTILDALSLQASKGNSLAEVARSLGVEREEVLAIGDNHNDLTMLRYAGLGIVMANAEDELKQMGFALTASNEEDGVGLAVEKYILEV